MGVLLAVVIVLIPFVPKEPTMTRIGLGVYAVNNPLSRKVTLNITCGSDWEQISFPMPAKSKQEIRFDPPASCWLNGY